MNDRDATAARIARDPLLRAGFAKIEQRLARASASFADAVRAALERNSFADFLAEAAFDDFDAAQADLAALDAKLKPTGR
jgi:hypothetical protein